MGAHVPRLGDFPLQGKCGEGSIPTVSTTYKTGLLVQWLGCITVYDVVRVRFPHRPQLNGYNQGRATFCHDYIKS